MLIRLRNNLKDLDGFFDTPEMGLCNLDMVESVTMWKVMAGKEVMVPVPVFRYSSGEEEYILEHSDLADLAFEDGTQDRFRKAMWRFCSMVVQEIVLAHDYPQPRDIGLCISHILDMCLMKENLTIKGNAVIGLEGER